MGCGASTSKVSQKDAVTPVVPEAEDAVKQRQVSNASIPTVATLQDGCAGGTPPPGAVPAVAGQAENETEMNAREDSFGKMESCLSDISRVAKPGGQQFVKSGNTWVAAQAENETEAEDSFGKMGSCLSALSDISRVGKPPAQDGDLPERYFKRERRPSHSSESMNPNNVQIVTHPKTNAEKAEIQKHLLESTNFLFKGLTDVRAAMLADAMFKKDVKAGEIVIKQGDDGDNFYLIGSGDMEVLVARDPGSEPVKVLEYSAGGTFGELALMYLCPRAATVKAVSDCMLWCLDRVQFRALMCGAEQLQANSQWEAFLEKVEVFNTLNKFERMTVANDLEEEDCGEDEMVIEQGDDDAEFLYILEAGSCAAILDSKDETGPVTLKEYVPGDYFGELALLEGGPRKASVKVTSEEAHVLKISTETFKGILEPVHEVMRKNAEAYKKLDDVQNA